MIFMGQAKQPRILSVRQDDEGDKLNRPSMFEYMVKKNEPNKIFFKTSHLHDLYRSLSLPRGDNEPKTKSKLLNSANSKQRQHKNKITKDKYSDLMALCSGATPIIRNKELLYQMLVYTYFIFYILLLIPFSTTFCYVLL